jgi:hypothetical protein
MSMPASRLRRFCPTPGRLVVGLLALEGFLLAAQWLGWLHKGCGVLIAIACVGAFMVVMLLWWLAALVFRVGFQFSLRSLFVLTLAVAVPCSWLATEMKWAREQEALVHEIIYTWGGAGYDYQRDASGKDLVNAHPPVPAWLRQWLGGDFFAHITDLHLSGSRATDAALEQLQGLSQLQELQLGDDQITDAGLEYLQGLTQLRHLDLGGTQVTDAGLKCLRGLTRLRVLNLRNTQVTDAGLEHLQGLTQLEKLSLENTRVTNAGLEHLGGLTQLQWLDLESTAVTDAGLEHLTGMTQLRRLNLSGARITGGGLEHLSRLTELQELYLYGTKVTDGHVKKLQQALPNCYIPH